MQGAWRWPISRAGHSSGDSMEFEVTPGLWALTPGLGRLADVAGPCCSTCRMRQRYLHCWRRWVDTRDKQGNGLIPRGPQEHLADPEPLPTGARALPQTELHPSRRLLSTNTF